MNVGGPRMRFPALSWTLALALVLAGTIGACAKVSSE